MKILETKNIVGMILGGIILIVDIFLRGTKLFYLLIALAFIVSILPFVISVVMQSGKEKEVDEKFLEFVRDLVENVKSGTPISKSIQNLVNGDYGALTKHVRKLSNQVSLGIPLTDAFFTMAKDTRSETISRAITLISQAERAGGEIDNILESVANSVNQIENLKKERKSGVFNLVVQGYIIFIVFIIIMIVLQYQILPMASGLAEPGISTAVKPVSPDELTMPMFALLLVQSFFTGLVIGKVSEGSFKDGIKHSFILVVLALLISGIARVFLG